MTPVLINHVNVAEQLVCHLHRHATEGGYHGNTVGMCCDVTLGALANATAPAKRKHTTAMAAPIGTKVLERLEAVGNAVVDLELITLLWNLAIADATGDNLLSTLAMARVIAVLTLAA